jgi:hypothetical protein
METKREQVTHIRDMVQSVANGEQMVGSQVDLQVYRMFGSISRDQASGIVLGLNMWLKNME